MIVKLKYLMAVGLCVALFSCHPHAAENGDSEDEKTQSQTPVTVTHVTSGPLVEYITLNAISTFRQSAIVKSNINGYVQETKVIPGDAVTKGEVLFLLETKEAENIGSAINRLDTSFHFSGKVTIRANADGFISQLNHKTGDYIQDGEQLAVINDMSSFRFVMNLPYELKKYVMPNSNVLLVLPDSTELTGTISSFLPSVDPVSQTQQVIIAVNTGKIIPENLVATVRIVKRTKTNTITLPWSAILSDEEQHTFWVMKLQDSTTAIKVPVQKGLESPDKVEILSPVFASSDWILTSGNYGLPDTAKVTVQQQP